MERGARRRVTLAQVAERAGVSVMTASYTYSRPDRVSPPTRARVQAAALELGYAGPDPRARSLRRGSTFLAGVADVCADRGYGMTILPITGGPEDVSRVTEAAVDGFIVWTTSDDDPVLAAIGATGRPAVIHGGPARPGLQLVSIDNRSAARAIGAVAFAGACRPAVVSHPLNRDRVSHTGFGIDIAAASFPVTRDRLTGYQEAAAAAGFAWDEVMVAVCGRNDADEAERLATHLLASAQPPDAMAAMSDQQALGVFRAARAAGLRVPGDLALTGWDDGPAAVELGLTTVAQSLRNQGVACAIAVLGEDTDSSGAPWSVVLRGSTRRAGPVSP